MEQILNDRLAAALLLKRKTDGNKGTFGRAFAYIGSKKFFGAAHLATEALLRGGCGYTEIAGAEELIASLIGKFPEAIYTTVPQTEMLTENEISALCEKSLASRATLIGSGSSVSPALAELVKRLLMLDTDAPIVLDADALNSTAAYSEAEAVIGAAHRPVIITPHEMEFSRLTGLNIEQIRQNRKPLAEEYARKYKCVIALKGRGTVITDGTHTYVNPTGSCALAKGGSGDALAGLLTSLLASSDKPALELTALACYIHGAAGDSLAEIYSEYGVTPSDLPRQMAKIMKMLSDLKF